MCLLSPGLASLRNSHHTSSFFLLKHTAPSEGQVHAWRRASGNEDTGLATGTIQTCTETSCYQRQSLSHPLPRQKLSVCCTLPSRSSRWGPGLSASAQGLHSCHPCRLTLLSFPFDSPPGSWSFSLASNLSFGLYHKIPQWFVACFLFKMEKH